MSFNFKLHKIKGRDNKPVPYKKIPPAQFADPNLPRNFWCGIFCGMRGSGKTEQAIKLAYLMEQSKLTDHEGNAKGLRHILFCPTIHANGKFKALKKLDDEDIHTEYTDEKLDEVLADIKSIKDEVENYKFLKKLFKKFNKYKYSLEPEDIASTFFTEVEAEVLRDCDYKLPEPHEKYPNGCITNIIFDDLIGSEAFSSRRGSSLIPSVLNGRHLDINIFILAQDIMKIPKSIRINTEFLVVFRYGQKKVIENLYDEVAGLMSFDKFKALYDEITKEDFSFLCIDHTQKKENRIKKNYEFIISI